MYSSSGKFCDTKILQQGRGGLFHNVEDIFEEIKVNWIEQKSLYLPVNETLFIDDGGFTFESQLPSPCPIFFGDSISGPRAFSETNIC